MALFVIACGSPEGGAPQVTPEPPHPPTPPVAAPTAEAPATPTPPAAPEPPPPPTELPPISTGPAVRLTGLEVTRRRVGEAYVPTVPLADAASRARLDTLLEELTHNRRCTVQLALETLVAVRCERVVEGRGGSEIYPITTHYRIGAAGDVEEIDAHEIFHPGTDLDACIELWLGDPEASPGDDLALTRAGIELGQGAWDDDPSYTRIPWRTVAPYVRADGPLGPALAAAGVPLAPPGTHAPNPPPRTYALGSGESSIGELLGWWSAMTDEQRAGLRFSMPPHGDPELLFPVDVSEEEVGRRARPRGHHRVFWREPTAELVVYRATDSVNVRARPSPRGELVMTLPRGTITAGVRGPVEGRTSDVGEGNWTLVGPEWLREGWVSGRYVVLADACGIPPRTATDVAGVARGVGELVRAGTTSAIAWFVGELSGTVVDIHPLEGCTVGARLRRLRAPGVLRDLVFTTTTREAGDTLIVVVTAASHDATLRTVRVFGPTGDAPIWSRDVEGGEIVIPEVRGPDGSPGHWPVGVRTEVDRVWLAWSGTALEEQRAPGAAPPAPPAPSAP